MAKLTLADVSNLLGNPTSAANTLNNNSALIEAALENTLSRDGTTPNQMEADLDMNHNGILNVDSIIVDGEDVIELIRRLESLIGQAGAIEVPFYDTAASASLANIKETIRVVQTGGYNIPGDFGHAFYKKVLSEPTHLGKFQSADGAWWEIIADQRGVSAISFGADASGGSNSTPAIQSAATFCSSNSIPILIPEGTYNLSTNVTAPGNIEWTVAEGALFTGAGNLPIYGGSNAGFRRPQETRHAIVVGTPTDPVSNVESGLTATLYSDAGPGFGARSAIVGYSEKHTTINDAVVQGGFFEADDVVGWVDSGAGANNFVEGLRTHGVVRTSATNGSAYGIVAAAMSENGATQKYLIGSETDIRKNGGTNSPLPDGLDPDNMQVGYLASCGGLFTADAGFMLNPYNSQKFMAGVHIPNGTVQTNAFYTDVNVSVAVNIDGSQSWASILLPNNSPIRGRDPSNPTQQRYLIGITASNEVKVGDTTATALVVSIPGLGEKVVQYGAADSAGVGFRTLRIAN